MANPAMLPLNFFPNTNMTHQKTSLHRVLSTSDRTGLVQGFNLAEGAAPKSLKLIVQH
jgi:hypothetical protein